MKGFMYSYPTKVYVGDGAAEKALQMEFARLAEKVWEIPAEGKTQEELAEAGVQALAGFVKEIGLLSTFMDMGITERSVLQNVTDSCNLTYPEKGSYYLWVQTDIQTDTSVQEGSGVYFNCNQIRNEAKRVELDSR